jgi:sucrose-phosphate synthase
MDRVLVAGDSGNDAEMLQTSSLGVVVANHSPELGKLRGRPGVYFAEAGFARGILDGIQHYGFMDDIHLPAAEEESETIP